MLSPSAKIYISDRPAMAAFAAQLAALLGPGDVVALNGQLGAGKTTLIQMLGEALGVDEKIVSPTFTLIHDYLSGRFPVLHADLYRLGPENAESVAEEILSVVQERSALVLIEWAEYGDFLEGAVTLDLRLILAAEDKPAGTTQAADLSPELADEPREIILSTTREDIARAFA